MQRLCGSMTMTANNKYQESGSLFQGSYKSKTVKEDRHLRYLAFYIQVKNVLEQYPGGLANAIKNFDQAWKWATQFSYSSLGAYTKETESPIIESELLAKLFPDTRAFKREAKEMLLLHITRHEEEFGNLLLEPY